MEKDNISFNEIYCNLRKITVSDRTKSKNGLDYLPWATAWDEICSHYNASYEFMTFDNSTTVVGVDSNGDKIMGGMDDPYLVTKAGLMVATSVTVEGHTRYMQLPVMDFRNTSMSLEERQVGKNKVAAATRALSVIETPWNDSNRFFNPLKIDIVSSTVGSFTKTG